MPGEDQGDHHRGYKPIRAIGIPRRSMNWRFYAASRRATAQGKKIPGASGNTELMVR